MSYPKIVLCHQPYQIDTGCASPSASIVIPESLEDLTTSSSYDNIKTSVLLTRSQSQYKKNNNTVEDTCDNISEDMYTSAENFLEKEGLEIISIDEETFIPQSSSNFVRLKRLNSMRDINQNESNQSPRSSGVPSCISRRMAAIKVKSALSLGYRDDMSQTQSKRVFEPIDASMRPPLA